MNVANIFRASGLLLCGIAIVLGSCVSTTPLDQAQNNPNQVRGDGQEQWLVTLTDANFDELVKTGDELKVVMFTTRQCIKCTGYGIMLEDLAQEYGEQVMMGQLNADFNRFTVREHNLIRIAASEENAFTGNSGRFPIFVFYQDGRMVYSSTLGEIDENYLRGIIDRFLGDAITESSDTGQ